MIEVGDQLKCRLSAGGTLTVEVEDRVLSDRSAGQYENGWWVSEPNKVTPYVRHGGGTDNYVEEGEEYFLSEEGVLYAEDTTGNSWRSLYQHAIGYHVPLMRASRNFERMIEAMAEGTFKCGTVCTCQQVSKPVQGCPLHGHLFTTT